MFDRKFKSSKIILTRKTQKNYGNFPKNQFTQIKDYFQKNNEISLIEFTFSLSQIFCGIHSSKDCRRMIEMKSSALTKWTMLTMHQYMRSATSILLSLSLGFVLFCLRWCFVSTHFNPFHTKHKRRKRCCAQPPTLDFMHTLTGIQYMHTRRPTYFMQIHSAHKPMLCISCAIFNLQHCARTKFGRAF